MLGGLILKYPYQMRTLDIGSSLSSTFSINALGGFSEEQKVMKRGGAKLMSTSEDPMLRASQFDLQGKRQYVPTPTYWCLSPDHLLLKKPHAGL